MLSTEHDPSGRVQNGEMKMMNEKENGGDTNTTPFRRIEFRLARKDYSVIPRNSDFKLVTLNPCSSSVSGSNRLGSSNLTQKNGKNCDLIDFALDPDLSFRISFQRIGAGLDNLGNTCYLNSVLQCLTYTKPLVAYLQSGRHQYTCRIAGFCALCAIHKHISRALQATGRILAPKDMVSNLRCISRNFRMARQEDAHEYMIQLLESMHKCCLPSGVPPESSGAYDKSFVYKIFGGRLRSQVRCMQCSYCSDTFDPFLDLSLEILKADSLYKALSNFTAPEQLDGGERQYKCERCKQKVRAVKQLTIYRPPYVLGIHLKRFRSYLAEKKIDKKVHFDSTLDLKPFVSGAYEGDIKYKLYGVLVHAGWSTRSGHYYCFVRTSSGSWYSLDDRRVGQVSERTVLEQKAYMLFYVRDRKNFIPKKAMDVMQKETLMTTMPNPSSSCPAPGVVMLQNSSKKVMDVVQKENIKTKVQNSSGSCSIPGVTVLKNGSERAMDVVQKEDIETNMQNPSNSCSIPGVKIFQSGCSDKNSKTVSSSSVRDTERSEVSEVQAQQTISTSSTQLKNDSEIVAATSKEAALKATVDSHPILSKSKRRLLSVKGSIPTKSSHCISRRQLMKSILKSGVVGMHLSTKILYVASLCSKKRIQCRRMKQRKKHCLSEKAHNKNLVSVDLGASTSGRISGSVDACKNSNLNTSSDCQRESEKDAIKKCPMSSGSSSIVNPVTQIEDRLTCSKVEVVNGKLLPNNTGCGLESNGFVGDSSCSKQLNSQPQNVANVAGGRVEEIAVGRWEGMESRVLSNGDSSVKIGYVLDDWDEEYDRGKRKKLRVPRNDYGGPNPFQQIAAKKVKLKVRTDTSNQPFRI